ncbi:unnamed protein product [Closterium sp. NIES-53]
MRSSGERFCFMSSCRTSVPFPPITMPPPLSPPAAPSPSNPLLPPSPPSFPPPPTPPPPPFLHSSNPPFPKSALSPLGHVATRDWVARSTNGARDGWKASEIRAALRAVWAARAKSSEGRLRKDMARRRMAQRWGEEVADMGQPGQPSRERS